MKNHFITKIVRKALLLQLCFPVLLIIVFANVLLRAPRDNFFNPRPLNYKSSYESFYNDALPHVTVSVPTLEYSGMDYVVDGHTRGHYYYTLVDGFCQFYLVSKEIMLPPAQRLEHMILRGRLVQLEDLEHDMLIKNMASRLNWSADSLKAVSSPYSVSTIPYPFYLNYFFYVTLYGGLIIALADILYLAASLVEPFRSPAFRYLGSLRSRELLFPTIEAELKHADMEKNANIYLTPDYFISTSLSNTIILPLDILSQVYYKTKRIRLGRKHFKVSYTLCVTVADGKTLEFPRCSKEEISKILNRLKHSTELDIKLRDRTKSREEAEGKK